jgi:hypothetical protein
MRKLTFIAAALVVMTLPAHAVTVTARVSGGATVHEGPGDRFAVIGTLADGTEIPVDQCTQNDSDSRFGSWIGDAGFPLRGANAKEWCRIPDTGWVARNQIVGRGLVNVTPPDFAGPGW